ncbi:GPO family capsid scaffolding protein [Novosphingobium panipatense]|uniref:GPO family capsid scaffolding protein n=1 Tax=Novosphingobium panipatense TaxID=428991 RepID=UPI00399EEB96
MATKTRFFRVAVEGATTDGRKIERQWLSDAAETYKPQTFTARVNMEHIRGFSPEAPFNAYGNVLALKTEEIDLDVGGKTERRLALFAQVDALDPLVTLNRAGQKLFTSIEIAPNFANTGKAYLVGLAVTDSPASLGTEMLQFAANQGDNSPLASRKQDKANLFTAADEVQIEFESGVQPEADPTGILASAKAFLDRFTKTGEPAPQVQTPPAVVTPPAPAAPQGDALAAFGVLIGQMASTVDKLATSTDAGLNKLTADLTALTTKVDAAPVSGFTQRPPATGGAAEVRTDC